LKIESEFGEFFDLKNRILSTKKLQRRGF